MIPEFKAFAKIPRWSRDIEISEKIDGTNAAIYVPEDSNLPLLAGQRTKWIEWPAGPDNFGFGRWVLENTDELRKLGPGLHRGEWYGCGIQRGYGLKDKRFVLFSYAGDLPTALVKRVPVLYSGPNRESRIEEALWALRENGSFLVRGFMQPEGIVIRHTASGALYKKTLENDDKPKGVS